MGVAERQGPQGALTPNVEPSADLRLVVKADAVNGPTVAVHKVDKDAHYGRGTNRNQRPRDEYEPHKGDPVKMKSATKAARGPR
jgi:hypothetical protein